MKPAVDSSQIGPLIAETIKALLRSRANSGDRFTDSDSLWGADQETGCLTSIQGLRSVFGALVALADDPGASIHSVVAPHLQSLLAEWEDVCAHLRKQGYDAKPYDRSNAIASLQRESGKKNQTFAYVDTASWVLSTAVILDFAGATSSSPAFTEAIRKSIREELITSLGHVLDAQCADGGWSWAAGAEVGHLYYTWSVIQGFADLYDYVLGESFEQIGIGPNKTTISLLADWNPDFENRLSKSRKKAVDFLSTRYLDDALTRRLELKDLTEPGRIEQAPECDALVVVYYELYLLEGLILSNFDLPNGIPSDDHRRKLKSLYRHVLARFADLRAKPDADEFWDPEKSTMRFALQTKKAYMGNLAAFAVRDGGLWPQFVRTMILYRFYTDPADSLDADIVGAEDSALRFLLDDRRPATDADGGGLWDKVAFNLGITTRSIESLIDVFDYLRRVRPEVATDQRDEAPDKLAMSLAEAIFPHIQERLAAITPAAPTPNAEYFVRDSDFEKRVLAMLADSLSKLPEFDGVTRKSIVDRLIGETFSRELKSANAESHELLGALTWLSAHIWIRMFDFMIQEAAFWSYSRSTRDGPNEVKSFRKFEERAASDPKGAERQAFAQRLRTAFSRIGSMEIQGQDGQPPNYEDAIARALTTSPPRTKGK